MTCIAFDGKKLVADKAATNCGYRRTVTKIFKVPDGMVGFCGNAIHAQELLQWFLAGAFPDRYPMPDKDDEHASAMLIRSDGSIMHYDRGPCGLRVYETFDAIGSGRDYALATMYRGGDAIEAVQVASHFDNGCGNGYDVIELWEIQPEPEPSKIVHREVCGSPKMGGEFMQTADPNQLLMNGKDKP